MTKKIFAMFLAVLMVVSLLPTSVFAASECPGTGNHTLNNCSYTVVSVTEPACGTYGFTTYKCNECKETFAESIVPATGEHTWEDGKDVAPTCGTAGLTGGKKCSVCGETKDGTVVAPIYKEGTACEWVAQNTDVDCTTGGTVKYVCAHCGATKEVKVQKTGNAHNWDYSKMTVKVEATAEKSGIVVIPCANENCPATKEIEWFADHSCAEAVVKHAAVEKTCTTDGEIAHWECRVCGKLYADNNGVADMDNELVANEESRYGGVIIKAGHTAPDNFEPGCDDQKVKCQICKTKYTIAGEHSFKDAGTKVGATCVSKGYITQQCENCKLPVITEIPALGHVEVTVTVPATCGTYAYTFTACMRDGCVKALNEKNETVWTKTYTDKDNGGLTYDVAMDRTVATELVSGVTYKLSTIQKTLNETLYMTYEENGNYFASKDEMSKGSDFYLEAYKDIKGNVVEGAYRLYCYYKESENPSYLYATSSDSGVGVSCTSTVGNGDGKYWTWNEKYGVLTAEVKDETYFLCAYNSYRTFGLSKISYITSATTYAAVLTYNTSEGVRLVDIDIDAKGGFDATTHNKEKTVEGATCYGDGVIHWYCSNPGCAWTKDEVIEKVDHEWNALGVTLTNSYGKYSAELKTDEDELEADLMKIYQKLGLTIDGSIVDKLAKLFTKNSCTTAGSYFAECEYCGAVEKKTLSASGHYFSDSWTTLHQNGSHTSDDYDYISCGNHCGTQKKYNVTAWADKNKNWDSLKDAESAHGTLTHVGVVSSGDCTTVGLDKYKCETCGNYVFVKRKNTVEIKINGSEKTITYLTGSHYPMIPSQTGDLEYTADIYKASKCNEQGYTVTYYCPICDKTIGNGKAGDKTMLPLAAHSFTAEVTEVDKITNPCPDAKEYKCEWCEEVKGNLSMNTIGSANLCTGMAYEVYICSCGEEHIRGWYGKFGHEWINYTVDKESTHGTNGSAHYTCAFCGEVKPVTLDKTPHKNAAGEEFTDKCTDTVTDRHCVLCCQCTLKGADHDCYKKDSKGNYICECMIVAKHHYNDVAEYKDSTCTMMPYYIEICDDCGYQSVSIANTAASFSKGWNVSDNGTLLTWTDDYKNVKGEYVGIPTVNVNFMGHKPAEVDKDEDGKELRYANYTYIEGYVYTYYEWEDVSTYQKDGSWKTVKLLVEKKTEPYTAKFVSYTEPTYQEEGSFETYCQICKANVEQTLAKKSGLGFVLDFANANGQSGFGFGSLVEVTVSADALKQSVYGFTFDLTAPASLTFVGYETINDDFVLNVTAPAKVENNIVKIVGNAANSAEGTMQNIEINGKTGLVKLYFRVTEALNKTTKVAFDFGNGTATKVENAKTTKDISATTSFTSSQIAIRGFLDFNSDGAASVKDLYTAMSLLTGENANGLTYDVTVDMNKDGEVTLEDLSIAYGYFVGNYTAEDILKLGLSAEELAILNLSKTFKCNNSKCEYTSSVEFTYCPKCGNHQ